MEIRIENCRQAPRWSTLETLLRETTNRAGRIISINRTDRGCNYRKPGEYRVKFSCGENSYVEILLYCQPMAEEVEV